MGLLLLLCCSCTSRAHSDLRLTTAVKQQKQRWGVVELLVDVVVVILRGGG